MVYKFIGSFISKLRVLVRRLCRFSIMRIVMGGERSVFCNNCLGAMVSHDYLLKFNSPTVNLWMYPGDYLRFVSNLSKYIGAPIEEKITELNYPVGLLNGELTIYFMHYSSFDEAVKAWRRREKRIKIENAYFILVEADGCTYDELRQFDALPYENKLIVACRDYPDLKCATTVKGFTPETNVTVLYRYNGLVHKVYDGVDWQKFLKLR